MGIMKGRTMPRVYVTNASTSKRIPQGALDCVKISVDRRANDVQPKVQGRLKI